MGTPISPKDFVTGGRIFVPLSDLSLDDRIFIVQRALSDVRGLMKYLGLMTMDEYYQHPEKWYLSESISRQMDIRKSRACWTKEVKPTTRCLHVAVLQSEAHEHVSQHLFLLEDGNFQIQQLSFFRETVAGSLTHSVLILAKAELEFVPCTDSGIARILKACPGAFQSIIDTLRARVRDTMNRKTEQLRSFERADAALHGMRDRIAFFQ